MATATGIAAYPVVGVAPTWRPLIVLGILGVGGLALAMMLAWHQAVGWSLSMLVAQYGLSMVGQAELDPAVILYAVSVLVIAELSLAVIERRPVRSALDDLTRFEVGRIAFLATLVAAIATLVLVVSSIDIPQGRWLPPVTVGAATAALWMLVTMARRRT